MPVMSSSAPSYGQYNAIQYRTSHRTAVWGRTSTSPLSRYTSNWEQSASQYRACRSTLGVGRYLEEVAGVE
eukprot:3042936-Rhodomonas_salina.1